MIFRKIHQVGLLAFIFLHPNYNVANAADVGSLEFCSIHEAGHLTVARSVGYPNTTARTFQNFKAGVGTFWKGQTSLAGGANGRGMGLIKLGGTISEHFLSGANRVFQPSFLDVIGHRDVISQSDRITPSDLAGYGLLEAQRKTYSILSSRLSALDAAYRKLFYNHKYP